MNTGVAIEVSKYSESLRNRLGSITDFKADFEKAFSGFVENALPKDEIYKEIEDKLNKKKTGDTSNLLAQPKKADVAILPNVHVSKVDQLAI